jgi:hypothetical protein
MYKKAIIPAIFMPISIYFSKFIWNPNVLLFLAPIYWYVLTKFKEKKKWWNYGIGGLLAGIMFQFHFQVGVVIGLTVLWLIFSKKRWKNTVIYILGVALGYAPLILFDLRNNFYNIRTIFLWVAKGGSGNTGLQVYYFLVWLPLLWVWGAKLVEKLSYKNWIWGALIVSSLGWVLFTKNTEDMPQNWNYLKRTTNQHNN